MIQSLALAIMLLAQTHVPSSDDYNIQGREHPRATGSNADELRASRLIAPPSVDAPVVWRYSTVYAGPVPSDAALRKALPYADVVIVDKSTGNWRAERLNVCEREQTYCLRSLKK